MSENYLLGSGRSPSGHFTNIPGGRSEIGCYLWALALFLVVATASAQEVRLIEDGVDESAGNVPCYVIETPSATYYLEKEGGGLSSMLDRDGVDWLGFHKRSGSESKGEYRGFPNAIHQQDGNYFHALNAGTDPSTSRVEAVTDEVVRIVFESGNGKWEAAWVFTASNCTFIMRRVSPGYHYWVLYEGVPGGELDKQDFWYASKDKERHSIDEKNEVDLPNPEWIAFGDPKSPRMIYLRQWADDDHVDRYYNMRDEMTVFGFGRDGGKKFLDSQQMFSIGFVESTDYKQVQLAADP